MNLSENQKILRDLKQILQYYDYLEYDESCSKGVDQLCIKVSDPNTHCSLGVIETICAQLGLGYKCEPEKPTRFYIRMMNIMNPDDYPMEYETENLRPKLNSASAYYERANKMHEKGKYEFAIEDYNIALRLKLNGPVDAIARMNLSAAKGAKERSDRERFYWEYHNEFLEREANRTEVLKRGGTHEWQAKRAVVLERDGRLCICGDTATEVHHKIYDNLGQEPLSDLVALCKNCHDGYHGRLFAMSKFFWHMRA